MSKNNVSRVKTWSLPAIVLAVSGMCICFAGPVTEAAEDSGANIALRSEAPIYAGPFEEGDLEPLSVEDFEEFGIEPQSPQDQYRQYRTMLERGVLGAQVPYRLRIVDRDLTLQDFVGIDVPEDVAEARYNGYLDMVPTTVDGRTVHYVYVYHRPLGRAESA